jgi:hypothetical protein
MTTAVVIFPLTLFMLTLGGWHPSDTASPAASLATMQLAAGLGALVCGIADLWRTADRGLKGRPSFRFAVFGLVAAAGAPLTWWAVIVSKAPLFVVP